MTVSHQSERKPGPWVGGLRVTRIEPQHPEGGRRAASEDPPGTAGAAGRTGHGPGPAERGSQARKPDHPIVTRAPGKAPGVYLRSDKTSGAQQPLLPRGHPPKAHMEEAPAHGRPAPSRAPAGSARLVAEPTIITVSWTLLCPIGGRLLSSS